VATKSLISGQDFKLLSRISVSELVQLKLNIETSVTKASSTIVSGGEYRRKRTALNECYRAEDEYRRSRDHEGILNRRRIEYRRKRTALNECYRAEDEYRRSRDHEGILNRRRIEYRRSARPLTNTIALRMVSPKPHEEVGVLRFG